MKTINDIKLFFKKNMVYILAALIGLLLIFGAVSKCQYAKDSKLLVEVAENNLRRHIKDSLATVTHDRDIAIIDSVNAVRYKEIKQSEKKVNEYKKESERLKKELATIYDGMTPIADLDTCNMVVKNQSRIISVCENTVLQQDTQIVAYKLTLSDLNTKYDKEKSETTRVRDMYKGCTDDNAKLIKALENSNTWWKRNEKFLYLGVGILIPVITVQALK